MMRSGRRWRPGGLLVAVLVLGCVAVASLAYGSRPVGLAVLAEALTAYDPGREEHLLIWTLRVPRTLLGLLVGAALGLAGAVMQGVARNPLADPGILGVNAGAALFVVVGIYGFGVSGLLGYVWFALAGAAVAAVGVYALGASGRAGAVPGRLALAGAAVTALLTSVTTTILLVDRVTFDAYRFWVVGSLAGRDATVGWGVLPFLAAGAVLAVGSARVLNALALGDDLARVLGRRLGWARLAAAGAVVLLAGAATAAAGPIGFVGLAVPHIARALVGADYRWILPYAAVLAPILLLGADVLGRLVARPGEVQVGIVTALLGVPLFVLLVRGRLARL